MALDLGQEGPCGIYRREFTLNLEPNAARPQRIQYSHRIFQVFGQHTHTLSSVKNTPIDINPLPWSVTTAASRALRCR